MNADDLVRVLGDPIAQELLDSPRVAHLAYSGSDGFPRVVPVGFWWSAAQFVVCTAPNAPKVRALARNPKVALSIDTDEHPPHVLLVRGIATLEVVDGVPDEYLKASIKSLPSEQHAPFEAMVRRLYKRMARIRITPHWAKVLDFETRFPVAVQRLVRGNSQ
jgi:pyridoxamine 5'-phosphate oxidase-like protein